MYLLKNQMKAFQYKNEYDLSQQRLSMQINHYQKLYTNQQDIRKIRHDISDKLVAISGLLSKGMILEATERINGIEEEVKQATDIINTGLPPIDAVINAKTAKSFKFNIRISHKIIIDNRLLVDQFDIATLIANALDNAIEGILRSENIERTIQFNLISTSDYITILVENQSTGLIYDDFRTSKPGKINHGFGIEQMKAIVKKYDGDINPKYNSETKIFTLNILIKNTTA
jgi:sensor histidine kinase regulating citrate/malate metabolism